MGTGPEDALTGGRLRPLIVAALLALPLAIGIYLRVQGLGTPSLWLDEILGYDLTTAAMKRGVWEWLTGFDAEHGPLYYATQLIGRIPGQPEVAARVAPVIFGVATIVVLWIAALRLPGNGLTAFCSVALLATSPLHVYYSREGRPYALSMLLAAGLLVALLRRSRALPFLVLATVYTSATAIPLAIAAIAAAFADGALTPDPQVRRGWWKTAGLSIIGLALAPVIYRGERPPSYAVEFPPIDVAFFDSLIRAFGVTAVGSDARGRTAVVIAVLALIGSVALIVSDRRRGTIVVTMAILPVVIALTALAAAEHWYAVRYVASALPAYLLLAGGGIVALGRVVARPLPERFARFLTPALALIGTAVVVSQTMPVARAEPFRKLDWRLAASTIWAHAQPGDVVIAAEPWSAVSARFYLDRLPPRVRLLEVTRPEVAESIVAKTQRAWLISGGYSPDTRVREWMCRYPILLASELEEFRIHYMPDRADFLRHRSTVHELRAYAASFGSDLVMLGMGREDDMLMASGWSAPEGSGGDMVRWAEGGRSEILLPIVTPQDRVITFRAVPLHDPKLPPQSMRVLLNGALLATLRLEPEWNDYSVEASSAHWRTGRNVLTFQFARATSPADLDPSLSDERLLSALFDTIVVGSGRAPAPPPARLVRLQELTPAGLGPFLDQESAWRDRRTLLHPDEWNRTAVQSLLGRLGFDVEVASPRLVRGEVRLEDVIGSVALHSGCADDAEFIRRTWQVVLARSPEPVELRMHLALLRASESRLVYLEKNVAVSDELREKLRR